MEVQAPQTATPTRLTITVLEFCDAVRISKSTFYLEVKAGRIQLLKAGAKTLVAGTEPTRYLGQMAAAAAARPHRRRGAIKAT